MTVPTTWRGIQGLDADRSWVSFGEIHAAVREAGIEVTEWYVRRELRRLPRPAVKRYGMYRYTREHMAAVLEALTSAANEDSHVRP